MNRFEKPATATALRASDFAREYFRYLQELLSTVDAGVFDAIDTEFEKARLNDQTIFVAGNGGSAATATTMANDLGFDVLRKTGLSKGFRVLALTDNNSVITAIGNDVGYDKIFINQLRIHYRPGDKLIVISASGNSPNVVDAALWVKEQGGTVIGLLGFDGGRLKSICDVVFHVPTSKGEYGPVEDLHLIANHVLAHWFQQRKA